METTIERATDSARDRLAREAGWEGFETDRFVFPTAPPAGKSLSRRGIEIGILVVVLLVGALGMKSFVVTTYQVPSESMAPTLQVGERFLVNRLALTLEAAQSGDVVVFNRPPDADVIDEVLVKRVVAIEGQVVEARQGRLIVDGDEIAEPYLPPAETTVDFGPVTVPAEHVFVLGDNRAASIDSRVFGPIPESLLVGRAFIRFWPADRIGTLGD